jgi:hypothetical protein
MDRRVVGWEQVSRNAVTTGELNDGFCEVVSCFVFLTPRLGGCVMWIELSKGSIHQSVHRHRRIIGDVEPPVFLSLNSPVSRPYEVCFG